MVIQQRALVIGVGSIGTSHLNFLLEHGYNCAVVDPNPSVLRGIRPPPGIEIPHYENLEAALIALEKVEQLTCFISNLGPDHFASAQQLINAGVRRIYLEKPMATSPADCEALVQMCEATETSLVVGFWRRGNRLVDATRAACIEHGDSEPSSIVVHAGALDISTTGVHWLDFATALFQSLPTQVIANGGKQAINPRSSSLFFWDGVVSWEFQQGQRLTIVFDNQSSLRTSAHVYSRNAVIIVRPGKLIVQKRDEDELRRDGRVTSHGYGDEIVEILSSEFDFLAGRAGLMSLLDQFEKNILLARESAQVTGALWGGLWALENSEIVALPLDKSHPAYEVRWAAS